MNNKGFIDPVTLIVIAIAMSVIVSNNAQRQQDKIETELLQEIGVQNAAR